MREPDPCRWVYDLDDIVSEKGVAAVKQIRSICNCQECAKLRGESHVEMQKMRDAEHPPGHAIC